jgi:Uma2 family endonuclease
MSPVDTALRPFEPGTTGWSAADLYDPHIERRWFQGRFEIIDGVLTMMAPAYYAGGRGLSKLLVVCDNYLSARGLRGFFAIEPDIILDESRVVRADLAYMSEDDERRQEQSAAKAGRSDPNRSRLLVPPTLIVESVSPGHEQHDRRTKFRWYAEFGVPNYWILDAFEKSLVCWVLDGSTYRQDAAGRGGDEIRPGLFPELMIPLKMIWGE